MRLLANYSKKVGEENYSNSSYSVTVETTTEVTAEKISETIDYLFLEAREGVNRQIEEAKANHQTNGKNGGNGKLKHPENFTSYNNRLPQENNTNQYQGNNNRFENQKQSNTNGNNNGGGNGNGNANASKNNGNGNNSNNSNNSNSNGNGHITEKQVSLLFGLLAKAGIKDRSGYLHDEFGIDTEIKSMSKKQGSRIIDHLLKVTNGAGA